MGSELAQLLEARRRMHEDESNNEVRECCLLSGSDVLVCSGCNCSLYRTAFC